MNFLSHFHHRKSKRTRNGDFLSLVRVLVSLRACEQTYINLPVTKRGESKSTVDTNNGINPRRKCDGRVSRQMNNRRARRCYPHFLAKLSRDRVIIITLASCKGEKGDDGCHFPCSANSIYPRDEGMCCETCSNRGVGEEFIFPSATFRRIRRSNRAH